MAKRKTFCGNARKCSMLLTHVTRSASYEALPNPRLFPAKSGLTSRFPLRNRGLWHRRSNKSGDAVDRPSRRSSLLGDPGAKFLVETGAPNQTMKNSLNYVSTCLRVVDTRRLQTRLLVHKLYTQSPRGTRHITSELPVTLAETRGWR